MSYNIASPANTINTHTMLNLFADYIVYHKGSIAFGEKRAGCTIQAYENKRKLLCQYLAFCNDIEIIPEDFTCKHLKGYFEFLLRRGYKHNYAARCAEILKDVVRYGVNAGNVRFNQLADFRMKKKSPDGPRFITPIELMAVESYRPTCSMTTKARDMFLYQCWSGMDYGDTATVSYSNLFIHQGIEYIRKPRVKTGVKAIIPLSEKCAELLSRHNYSMRLLSNAKYNKALKTMAEDLGIRTHLTTHIGRKTFAMHKLNYEGYSVQAVSRMLGHSSVKTTEETYVSVELDLVHSEFCKLKQTA